ncbi:trans-sulfuration enzyme family protein [Halococcus sediminicola]|uniref:trans-sulfuration enzyme family protein n=1 Tax=Halococcus sediminicola TaxID=1264579 RepID=UPI000679088B|nr:PLP-dependent aspartate aminotransferase family protein [Halococcus sediminicola]
MDDDRRFDTTAIGTGGRSSETGDVVRPIHLSSTFELDALDPSIGLDDADPAAGEFLYSRLSNPTRHALEERLAALEGGDRAFAFSSGTAAIATTVLSVVEPGDHVVAFDGLYAGTQRLLETVFESRLDVAVDFVDATDPGTVAAAIEPETTLVMMETPTNPLLKLCDIEAIAAAVGDATFIVDNTFLSPYFQQPLDLGADVVVHSTTKYINGHSDSVGGAAITSDDDLAATLEFHQRVGLGDMLAPFDSFLVARGLKTLPVRMERHEENASILATHLDEHEAVRDVHYPGLDSHPQHELARAQQSGFGGVLSFELDGDFGDARAFLEALDVFSLAVSLGGVESLIEHPAGMTHEPIPRETRLANGITDTLIRVSVGIEHPEDLLADLERGFAAVERADAAATD